MRRNIDPNHKSEKVIKKSKAGSKGKPGKATKRSPAGNKTWKGAKKPKNAKAPKKVHKQHKQLSMEEKKNHFEEVLANLLVASEKSAQAINE